METWTKFITWRQPVDASQGESLARERADFRTPRA
jgi:hypothetical protein